MAGKKPTAAHIQGITNRYSISYPEHGPREGDPNYPDFHEWKRRQKADGKWRCAWAAALDDDTDCDTSTPLEAHHSHLEYSLANGADLKHLAHLYPGIDTPDEVGAWIESDTNLMLLCARHHRSTDAGIHHLSASDHEAYKLVLRGTFGPARP
jgi:hypothetical protein